MRDGEEIKEKLGLAFFSEICILELNIKRRDVIYKNKQTERDFETSLALQKSRLRDSSV